MVHHLAIALTLLAETSYGTQDDLPISKSLVTNLSYYVGKLVSDDVSLPQGAKVTATPLISTYAAVEPAGDMQYCSQTCTAQYTLEQRCNEEDSDLTGIGLNITCQCTSKYFQIAADCLVCGYDPEGIPRSLAQEELRLELKAAKCHDAGMTVTFTLQFPSGSEVQALIDKRHHDDFQLRRRQTTFLALQVAGGHVGLVLVLALAALSRGTARRDATFYNFCVTWIMSSVFYSILLYRGIDYNFAQIPQRFVPFNTCVAQAALLNGAQVMTACATMAFAIQGWISLRIAIYGDTFYGEKERRRTTILFLMFPYVFFLAFFIPSIFVGQVQFQAGGSFPFPRALPTTFYCSITNLALFSRTIYGVTVVLLSVTAVFDVLIIRILYRHWRAFHKTRTTNPISPSVFIRMLLCTLYRTAVAITYGTVIDTLHIPDYEGVIVNANGEFSTAVLSGVPIWVDMLQAAIPLVAFLVLGLNTRMFTALVFWRRTNSGTMG